MTPDRLASLLTNLEAAAEVVDAIENPALQRRRGWDLGAWKYDLVPWGVRFRYQGDQTDDSAEILAVLPVRAAVESSPQPPSVLLLR